MNLGRSLLSLSVVAITVPVLLADVRQAEECSTWEPSTDLVITNVSQLSDIFLQGYSYPTGAWVWAPREFDPTTMIWADHLPPELVSVTNCATRELHGVPAWPLWITLYPLDGVAGEISVLQPWSESEMVRIAVPQGFDSWQAY